MVIGIVIGILLASSLWSKEQFETTEPTEKQINELEKVFYAIKKFEYEPEIYNVPLTSGKCYSLCKQVLGTEEMTIEIATDYYQYPSETIEKEAGDCEDFSILIVSAAKHLGIPARVVEGVIKVDNEVKPKSVRHTWSEVYYNGKWRPLDPNPAGKTSFKEFLSGSTEDVIAEEIICKYDDLILSGNWDQRERFNWLSRSLKEDYQKSLRANTNLSEQKIEEIATACAKEAFQIAIEHSRVPDDPRSYIQPDNPRLKEWVDILTSA
ncbi:MAG: transglutaminase domain-containing protein [Patescibacteria group bacterium]|nr:transglutaminase domain-containing protein [Patescibacteria group bacterium]